MARTPAICTAAGLIISGLLCAAQPEPSAPLTLEQAVDAASKNYPSIRVSQEQMNAAAEGIRLARTAYLPRVDALAQINRATRNNVFGLLLPQNTIPSISGPVIGSNNSGTVWGSALGALATWEPFDFGLRRASITTAEATRTQAESSLKRSQLEIATATIDAYLTLAAAQEIVRTAQAGVDRGEIVVRLTDALVNAQLRPGADSSRAKAELAVARTQLIQSRQAVDVASATLSQFVGLPPDRIVISAPALLQPPPGQTPAQGDFHANPIAMEQDAAVDQARSQLRALERSYFPKFSLQAAVYARGTGAETDGSRLGGLNGLAPTVQNFAVGFSISFPILDLPALRARQAAQTAAIRAQTARSDQIVVELKARWNIALAQLHGARDVEQNTPIQVTAARDALQQASARYQAGLGAIDPVAEAQHLLTQAETDDALSHLAVWRALLGLAAAAGDLQPFVVEAGK
jgi:outer membrane protein TolC